MSVSVVSFYAVIHIFMKNVYHLNVTECSLYSNSGIAVFFILD